MFKTAQPSYRMLIVEDDPEVRTGLQDFFHLLNYDVNAVADGDNALSLLRKEPPFDVVILDLMLPTMTGFDVLRDARAHGVPTPVIMLTARGEQDHVLRGFQMGADDYITKPFSADELAARVRAVLSRALPPAATPMDIRRFGNIEVNFSTHQCFRESEEIHLTMQEFELLHYLLQNQGRVVSREQLLQDVWKIHGDVITRTVDRHMASLRKKIEPNPSRPSYIETIYGKGYRFRPL